MKFLIVFLVLSLICVTFAQRGCLYDSWGRCRSQCPEGTHAYVSSCGSGTTWSEKTCDHPEARDIGQICDLSRCDCDPPTVKDRKTGKCVKIEDCTK